MDSRAKPNAISLFNANGYFITWK